MPNVTENPYAKIVNAVRSSLVTNISLVRQEAALCCSALCYADFIEKALGIPFLSLSRDFANLVKTNRKPCISAMRNMITARRQVVALSPVSDETTIRRDAALAIHIGYDACILCLAAYLWREFMPVWTTIKADIPCDSQKAEEFLLDYAEQGGTGVLSQVREAMFL